MQPNSTRIFLYILFLVHYRCSYIDLWTRIMVQEYKTARISPFAHHIPNATNHNGNAFCPQVRIHAPLSHLHFICNHPCTILWKENGLNFQNNLLSAGSETGPHRFCHTSWVWVFFCHHIFFFWRVFILHLFTLLTRCACIHFFLQIFSEWTKFLNEFLMILIDFMQTTSSSMVFTIYKVFSEMEIRIWHKFGVEFRFLSIGISIDLSCSFWLFHLTKTWTINYENIK